MIRIRRPLRLLWSNRRGATLVEFALVVPVLFALLVGMGQVGILFLANAGLRNAVEDAARFATIYPRPDQAAITSRIASKRWGLNPSKIVGPTVTFNNATSPNSVDISMGYNLTINYVLGSKNFVLTETRRAYIVS